MQHWEEPDASEVALIWLPSFGVALALVVLLLSVGYTVIFGHMLYVSLEEQVWHVDPHPPRYAPHVHFHSGIEWLLITLPVLLGLLGIVGSAGYLLRRRAHG